MANERARNLQDASLNPVAFAMGAASASTNSTSIDLGTDTVRPEGVEFQLSIPALLTGVIPDASTVSLILETSDTSVFTAVTLTQTYIVTGATGTPATTVRFRIPSNSPRYARFKTTRSSGGTTAAAFNATGTVRL